MSDGMGAVIAFLLMVAIVLVLIVEGLPGG